jgi:hypothetical protein
MRAFLVSTRKKKPGSLLRRLFYFLLMVLTGGGAGVGGWAFKDHPRMQALLGVILGKGGDTGGDGAELKSEISSAVKHVLKRDDSRQPGVFKVKITEINLAPKLFRDGRTVDIQARVCKIDPHGQETTVWESRNFGENLCVAGKDDLTFAFLNRPFEIEWTPGEQVVVEVWDRKGTLFERRELKMALSAPGVFPLASGTHALEVASRDGLHLNSDLNRIVFQSQRVAASQNQHASDSRVEDQKEVAERPIVIK